MAVRLLVVSHTPHHQGREGIVGWGPTVRELTQLATRFDRVVHVAPLHPGPPAVTDELYGAPYVRLRPVRPAGGPTVLSKLGILAAFPGWARAIREEMASADVIHVRCPAHIGLLGLVLSAAGAGDRRVWVKYAGSWRPPPGTPLASRLQRAWLARETDRWMVTVNPGWEDLPPHVRMLPNPCLHADELWKACASVRRLEPPMELLFAGRVDREKGADTAIEVLARARQRGLDIRLGLAGDGALRQALEREASGLGLGSRVAFHGWVARDRLFELYRGAHFLLLPSRSEGWPKAIAEAMAHGVVPLASRVGSIPHYLGLHAVGRTVPVGAVEEYVDALEEYADRPARWRVESRRALAAARSFTYEEYVARVATLLGRGGDPMPRRLR